MFLNKVSNKKSSLITYIDIEKVETLKSDWAFSVEPSKDVLNNLTKLILSKGLLDPIIVWQRGDTFQILSGHRRVTAYKEILNEPNDLNRFDKEKYRTIPAIIYKDGEIDESLARKIMILS